MYVCIGDFIAKSRSATFREIQKRRKILPFSVNFAENMFHKINFVIILRKNYTNFTKQEEMS